jgi:hypothetical protein
MAAGGDWRKVWMSSFLVAVVLFGLGNLALSFTAENSARKLESNLFVEDEGLCESGEGA